MVTPSQVNFYVDESCIAPDIILIALVVVDNLEYEKFILGKIQEKQKSPLYKEGNAVFHHAEDFPSIRQDIASWILRLAPLSVYFLIQRYDSKIMDEMSAKRWVYEQVFPKKILSNIFLKYQKLNTKPHIDIAFENLTDKPNKDREFFAEGVNSLGFKNIHVRVVDKKNLLTTLPDYMAGILRGCISEYVTEKTKAAAAVNIKLIQNKIGLITIGSKDEKFHYYERGKEVQRFIDQGYSIDT